MLIEPLSVQEQIRTCKVIFVYLPGSIRDLIALTPLLKNLRSTYPNQELVAIGKPNISDILGANQIFDRFLTKPSKSSGLIGYVRFIKQLRQLGSSAGILYRNSIASTIDLVLAGSQVRVGPKNAIYPLLTHCSEPIKKLSCMDQYKLITQKLVTSNGDCLPNLLVDAKSSSICEAVFRKHSLNSDEILVGFNPGSDNGETKKWISDYFGELAHKISDQVGPVRFMVFGGPGNEAQADQICDLIGPRSINLSKECLGLNHVKPFFSRMDLFITNDSGLRWYAAAMQIGRAHV